MRKLLLLTALFMAFSACAGKKAAWIDNPHKLYPESKYLVSVGSGDTLESAKSRAVASIASMIKVNIKGDLDVTTTFNQLKKNEKIVKTTEKNTIRDNTKQKTDEELMGISYGETYTDKNGLVYAVAYLDRQKAGTLYKEKVGNYSKFISNMIANAQKEKSVIEKYAFLSSAVAVAVNSEKLQEQLLVINKNAYHRIDLPYRMDQLKVSYHNASKEMPFKLLWNSEEDSKIKDFLTEIITNAGFVVGSNEKIIVKISHTSEKVELKNKYYNLKWKLSLNIMDTSGNTIASIDKSARTTALSESDAKNRSYIKMKKIISKKLPKLLADYFVKLIK